jgi:hypothetical protein
MAKPARRPKKAANGYVLPAEKFKQRERGFAKEYPHWAASRGSLENWSRQHDWVARVREHDNALARGRAQGVRTMSPLQVAADCSGQPTSC